MKTTDPSFGKKCLSKIVLLSSLFFAFSTVGAQAATVSCTNPVTGNSMQATINFDKASYNNGDPVTVTAHYTEGSWALCLYPSNGGLPVATTTSSQGVDKSLQATIDADQYGNGNWTAVIAFNNACNSSYRSGSNFCPTSVSVTGGTENGDGENNGGNDTGGNNGAVSDVRIDNPIQTNNFTALVQNVLRWILSVVGGVALLMLIYGGVLYVTSTGDQKQADQGKRVITWTIVGLVLILLSYSIMRVVNDIFTR